MTCRHLSYSEPLFEPGKWKQCTDCREYIGLGPSNDELLAVAIEIKAAQWAIEYDRPSRAGECLPDEVCTLCQARHLADVIREHGGAP